MKKLILLVLVSLSLPALAAERDGNESHGGGTDTPVTSGPAWFLGKDRVVHACVELAPDFRLVPDLQPRNGEPSAPSILRMADAVRLVRQAHDQWFAYMKDRGIFAMPLKPGDLDFASGFEVTAGCDRSADLRIYFGAEDALVKHAKKQFRNPFGFAYSPDRSGPPVWRPGIIWITAPGPVGEKTATWTFRRLTGELLHELGHTLGSGHVDGTVMDPEQLRYVFAMQPEPYFGPEYAIDQIDQARTLIHGKEPITASRVVDWGKEDDSYGNAFAFKFVFGRGRKGFIHSSINAVTDLSERRKFTGTLRIADDLGEKVFRIDSLSPFSCETVGDVVFSRYHASEKESWGWRSETCRYTGTLTDPDGVAHPIAVNQDGEFARLQISLLEVSDIFSALIFDYQPPENTSCEPNPACNFITEPKP